MIAVGLVLCTLAGCNDDGEATSSGGAVTPPSSQKELVDIQISPVTQTSMSRSKGEGVLIQKDSTVNFVAVGTYSNNEQEILTDRVSWNTNNENEENSISLDQSGWVTGENGGATGIYASIDGLKSNELIVNVGDEHVTKVQITESSKTLPVGAKHKLVVMGQFSDGSYLPLDSQRVNWGAEFPEIVDVDSAGVVTQKTEGTSIIEAAYNEFSSQSEVTGVQSDLESIQIVPGDMLLPQGWTRQFYALAIYDSQTYVDITELAKWEAADQKVASMTDEPGEILGQGAGETIIQATWQGVKGSTALTVENAALERIMLTPRQSDMLLGASLDFTAIAVYSNGGVLDVSDTVTWSVSDSNVTHNGSGKVISNGSMPNSNPVVVSVLDPETGITAESNLKVHNSELTSIIVNPTEITLGIGEVQKIEVVGVYNDGSTIEVSNGVEFIFDDSSVVSEFDGEITGLKEGDSGFTVQFEGISVEGELTVADRKLVSISVTPEVAEIIKGQGQQYSAIGVYDNGTTKVLTGEVFWSAESPVTFDPTSPGLASSDAAIPSAKITAQLDNITSEESDISVIEAGEVVEVIASVKNSELHVGETTNLLATAVYENGKTSTVTEKVTWVTKNGNVTVDQSGKVTANKVGDDTITGKYLGHDITAIALNVDERLSDVIVALDVKLDSNVIFTGEQTKITTEVIYADGNRGPVQAEIAVNKPELVTVIDSNTLQSNDQEGAVTVTAKYQGLADDASLHITKNQVVRLFVSETEDPETEIESEVGDSFPKIKLERYEFKRLNLWAEYANGVKEPMDTGYKIESSDHIVAFKGGVMFSEFEGTATLLISATGSDIMDVVRIEVSESSLPSWERPHKYGQSYYWPATTDTMSDRVEESLYESIIELPVSRFNLAMFDWYGASEFCNKLGLGTDVDLIGISQYYDQIIDTQVKAGNWPREAYNELMMDQTLTRFFWATSDGIEDQNQARVYDPITGGNTTAPKNAHMRASCYLNAGNWER